MFFCCFLELFTSDQEDDRVFASNSLSFRTSFNSTVDYRRAAPVHLTVGLKVLVLVLTW